MDFNGKVGVVTGAAGGIGRALSLELARQGASVAVADLDGDKVRGVEEEIRGRGGVAMAFPLDVSREDEVTATLSSVTSRWGRLDFLVNGAGYLRYVPVAELSLKDWQGMINTHLTGTFLCCRAALGPMRARKAGSIVNFSSGLGAKGATNAAHYAASKAGIVGFTKSLAMEVAPDGIRVNAVAPGPIDTALLRGEATEEEFAREIGKRSQAIPMGRIGMAEDVVGPCLFLLSDMSCYVTGQTLHVNGGGYLQG